MTTPFEQRSHPPHPTPDPTPDPPHTHPIPKPLYEETVPVEPEQQQTAPTDKEVILITKHFKDYPEAPPKRPDYIRRRAERSVIAGHKPKEKQKLHTIRIQG